MASRSSLLARSAAALVAAACARPDVEPSSTYFDREIGPILLTSCASSPTQSGCHVAADDRGNALGNLDVTSFEALSRRRDLLVPYGPYGMPALLVKAVPGTELRLGRWDSTEPTRVRTDVPHAGGQLVSVTSASFNTLLRWMSRGATENNVSPPARQGELRPCSGTPGTDPAFDPAVDPAGEDFAAFRDRVGPLVTDRCAAGNCHGTPANSLYLTCGDTPEALRWNHFALSDYVSREPASSEILRRTLAPEAGGTYHEGGAIFQSTRDAGYRALLDWATEKGGPSREPTEPGFRFFAERVQPMLVKRGCVLIGCHSPAMGHEYRLRAGSAGHFGLPATRRNYELSLEQVAFDSPDPNASRILRKNLEPFVPGAPGVAAPRGVLHRGGALFGAGRDDCDAAAAETGPLDEQDPYCVIRRWIELEHEERAAATAPFSAIVYVARTPSADAELPQDFARFYGGADLLRAPVVVAPGGAITVGAPESLLAACGLAPGGDVRRPAVSWDGARIAFAARARAEDPLRIYVVEGGACALEPTIALAPVGDDGVAIDARGELIHDFDPAFSPDGRLVFASTRGNVTNVESFDYRGPQRSPADPSRPNANLYVVEGGAVRQLTFLLNQELEPSFMTDGRLIFVTEKRAPGFYQLAARRQNLDGGDYHPLFGQRATIGHRQVTSPVELADKNFAAIFSEPGVAHGAGALGVVNRSLGVDQASPEPSDYLQDPAARDWQNPRFFQRSVRILDGASRPGESGGVYRSPARLPDGRILASYAADVADPGSFSGRFELVVVDPIGGARSAPILSEARDVLWAVPVAGRGGRGVYRSKLDEPNGATRVSGTARGPADVTFLDVPLTASLLFQNTRSRRIIPAGRGPLELWESLPPEPGVTSLDPADPHVVEDEHGRQYVRRRRLGSALPLEDYSLRVRVPGGMPLVLAPEIQLSGDRGPVRHHQLEELQFYPGETVHIGFRGELFNGVCGSCHGTLSGLEHDVAVNPDILTQASAALARDAEPVDLTATAAGPSAPPFP